MSDHPVSRGCAGEAPAGVGLPPSCGPTQAGTTPRVVRRTAGGLKGEEVTEIVL
jgi:hypothetical protein